MEMSSKSCVIAAGAARCSVAAVWSTLFQVWTPNPDDSSVWGMALFDALLAWLVSVVGVATGAAYIPQALRIWKRGSSDDVSILTYLLFLGGQLVYLVYGVRIR